MQPSMTFWMMMTTKAAAGDMPRLDPLQLHVMRKQQLRLRLL
jgi:hypothetical protein